MAKRKVQRKKSHRAKKHSNFTHAIQRLKSLKAGEQQQAMNMANNTFIRQFCKHLKKLKRVKLSHKKKRALRKHKKQLRQLMSARTPISKRRRILTQSGGGVLKSILSAIPIVGTVLNAIDSF